jgi:hypothetical protein
MCNENPPNTLPPVLPMAMEKYAQIAILGAIWLVRESLNAVQNKTSFNPDPDNCFAVLGNAPAIRDLRDLTEEQRFDMFVEGFRSLPDTGAQTTFENLLNSHKEWLLEALRERWNALANS